MSGTKNGCDMFSFFPSSSSSSFYLEPGHGGQQVEAPPGDPKSFPGQPGDIVPPACPGSALGSLPGGDQETS